MFNTDAPIVVYIHGGYWQELSKMLSAYPVRPLNAVGYKVAIVEYDLCPAITLVELVKQLIRAAVFLDKYSQQFGARF